MQTRYIFISALIIPAVLLVAAGCAPKIPRDVAQQVTFQEDFKTLQADPAKYEEEFVIFGGQILSTENFEQYSEITVVQFPTDAAGRPRTEKKSGGRFLVRSESFLDPEIHAPGTLITAAGTVAGAKMLPIGEFEYLHPVIEGEVWTWKPRADRTPRFHFGLGIGKTF